MRLRKDARGRVGYSQDMDNQLEPGIPVSLADLVAYQPASVVSRQLLKQEKGNVTLFAFDGGEGLTEHTSPFAALVQILEGQAEITVGGAPHPVSAGQVLLLPASVPHGLKAMTPFKMLLTMIRG